jgi:uridine phosphorylase
MDGMLNYYERQLNSREAALNQIVQNHFEASGLEIGIRSEVAEADRSLAAIFDLPGWYQGITVSATGFYAPQSRTLRAKSSVPDLFHFFDTLEFENLKVTNLEMETAAIFGLANILGHKSLSLNALLATGGQELSVPILKLL